MILVAGATGILGGRIARSLLERGKELRVLVRNPSPSANMAAVGMATSVESLVAASALVVSGDLTDRASLDAACAGVATVITTATATRRDFDLERVDLNSTLNLIAAATQAGVRHFIYTSAYGCAVGHPVPLFHIKATCEQALEQSGMRWTTLRPNILAEAWIGLVVGVPLQAGRPIMLVGRGDHRHAFISEADVAAFAAAAVENPLAENACIAIGGSAHSWTEVVALVGEAIGRDLPVCYVAPDDAVLLLDPAVGHALANLELYETVISMGDLPAQFGVELTPLPVVLRRMFHGEGR